MLKLSTILSIMVFWGKNCPMDNMKKLIYSIAGMLLIDLPIIYFSSCKGTQIIMKMEQNLIKHLSLSNSHLFFLMDIHLWSSCPSSQKYILDYWDIHENYGSFSRLIWKIDFRGLRKDKSWSIPKSNDRDKEIFNRGRTKWIPPNGDCKNSIDLMRYSN